MTSYTRSLTSDDDDDDADDASSDTNSDKTANSILTVLISLLDSQVTTVPCNVLGHMIPKHLLSPTFSCAMECRFTSVSVRAATVMVDVVVAAAHTHRALSCAVWRPRDWRS